MKKEQSLDCSWKIGDCVRRANDVKIGQDQEAFLSGILLALAAGILLGHGWQVPIQGPAAGTFLLCLLGGCACWRGKAWTWIVFLGLFVCLGMLRFLSAASLPADDISVYSRQVIGVKGYLREEARITPDAQGDVKVRYLLSVSQVKQPGHDWQRASGGLYIYDRAHEASEVSAQVGDVLTATGKIRLPSGCLNPGQIDTRELLQSQDIAASLSAGKQGVHLESRETEPFRRWTVRVRQHYRQAMEAVMPKADAAAIFAMLFGGYDGIRPELLEAFTTTGIVHILSVSGSHISLLAAVMAWLGGLLRLPKGVTAGAVIGAIVIYSILAGCVPPVIRSAAMGGLTFLALALEREKAAGRLLLLTGMVMLLASPLLLFNISFQLSFLATAGLLYLAPGIRRWLRVHGSGDFIAGSFSITIAAQLATMPVLAWYFNQLSLSSLLANLLVVPIVEFMIVVGLFAGIVAFLLPICGRLVFTFDSLLLGLVYEMTRVLARLPGSQVWFPSMSMAWSVLYYGGLGFFCLSVERQKMLRAGLGTYKQPFLVGVLALLVFAGGWRLIHPPMLAVHFLAVGQGDCALVVTPCGHAFLFDTGGTRDGTYDVGARIDVPYLLHYGVLQLDAVFLTHCHEDHAAGCGSVLRKLPVGHVFTADEGVREYARSMKLGDGDPLLRKFSTARQGERFTVDGVTIDVLFAPSMLQGQTGSGNEASNVYRISYGKASFLITGDLTREKEQELLAADIDPQSTVLKAGHHGSDTSSSPEFLQAVRPAYGIFCVGVDNSFGHPKPKIVERYRNLGIKTFRTDEDGAIVFHTDGDRISLETYTGQ